MNILIKSIFNKKSLSTLLLFSFLTSLFTVAPLVQSTLAESEEYVVHERLDLRTESSKTYQTGPKNYRTELYNNKIHYLSEGSYLDIDNQIVEFAYDKYKYKNSANDFSVYFGETLAEGIKYSGPKGECSFKLSEIKDVVLSNSTATIRNNIITYSNIYPDANLEYTVTNNGIKTEVVAKNQNALKSEIAFELTNCDESILDKPVLTDEKDIVEVSEEIVEEEIIREEIKDKRVEKIRKLVIKPDYSKLGEINGEVRIDPSIITPSPSVDVFTSILCPGHARRFIAIGDWRDSATGIYCGRAESYLHFDLSSITPGVIITKADLSLYRYQTDYLAFNATIDRITEPGLNSSTGSSTSDFYAHTGNYASSHIPLGNVFTEGFREFKFNILNLVKEWTNGTHPNYGLAVFGDVLNSSAGAAFCSTRYYIDGFCSSNAVPVLSVEYYTNTPPATPNPLSPTDNSEFSGNCDESAVPTAGICRTQLSVTTTVSGVGDSDPSPGDLRHTVFTYSGSNNFQSSGITGSGNVSHTANFSDGTTYWKAQSFDNVGAAGNYSPEFRFTTDTTPPDIPNLNSLPAYTAGVGIDSTIQVELDGNRVNDNISNQSQISYYLEYSKSSNFSSNVFSKTWQPDNPHFEIGPRGSDGVAGNADDISDNNTYYFRLKARDKLGNITNWSNIVSTTIDGTKPVVNSFSATEERFSPNNATSLGIKDSTTFDINYTEKNPKNAYVEIYTDLNRTNVVKTFTRDISNLPETANFSFTWDGKNNANQDLPDGPYVAYTRITDQANQETLSNSVIVIVDNSGANITISSPSEEYWTKEESIDLSGQATAPNIPGEEDSDLTKLEIRKATILNWTNVSYDSLGIFSQNISLDLGKNTYHLRTTDTVGNTEEIARNINRENTAPVLSNIKPDNLTNNTKPEITFNITDPDPTNNGAERSDIKYGTNPNNIKLSLIYKNYISSSNTYEDVTKILIDNGVNLEPALVEDLNCNPAASSTTSTKNGVPVANSVDCILKFKVDLQPDSVYKIHIQAKDIAQNEVVKDDVSFTLDSHIYSELMNPLNGSIYSTSSVLFRGEGSKNSSIEIKNTTLNKAKTFVLNEALNNTGKDSDTDPNKLIATNFVVVCGKYKDVDGRSDTKDEEICSWEVRVWQKYTNTNQNTENTNTITLKDAALNMTSNTVVFNVNLYAFDLEITSDLRYFSPNGDGNQDGIKFSHTAINPTDPLAQPEISDYELRITNSNNKVIRIFKGNDILPPDTFWNGMYNPDCNWSSGSCDLSQDQYVPDGEYTFVLTVTTTDNAIRKTEPQKLTAKTVLLDEVVITSPKDGAITTNGVINVQGQAPKPQVVEGDTNPLRGKVYVDICVDTVSTSVSCDLTTTVETDENGFFSSLVLLPRLAQEQILHNITAKARDGFGNSTKTSNKVQVIQDTLDPFKSVKITPALTGINTKEDYDRFLRGEIPINKLKTLILSAEVTQNTEGLSYSYAEYTNLNQKPDNPEFYNIATVNNTKEDNPNLNPYNLATIKKNHNKPLGDSSIPTANCDLTNCMWERYLPVNPDFGGIYEVKFTAKKGDVVQDLYAGFKADGNIPSAPIILSIEKWNEKNQTWITIDPYEGKFYTNGTKLRLRGAADPNIYLKVKINDQEQSEFQSSELGIWEYEYIYSDKLANLIGCKESMGGKCVMAEFNMSLISYRKSSDGTITNKTSSSNSAQIVYDAVAPKLENIDRKTPDKTINGWAQTGMPVQFSIDADEKLIYADLIKNYDGFVRLLRHQGNDIWIGDINADGPEGYFHTDLRLIDLAGNISFYTSKKQYEGVPDWRIFIDNTKSNPSSINKTNWDTDSGIKADGKLPEIGRLNPEYVIRSDSVTITGKAEKGQRIEILVNKTLSYESTVSDAGCINTLDPDKVTQDGLVVKYKEICSYSYTYKFPDNGENTEHGVPIHSYIFQVRVLDKAANYSAYSKQEIIYHDKTSPKDGDITNIFSESYDPIIDWNSDSETPITKDININVSSIAERLSDLNYKLAYESPDVTKIQIEDRVVMNGADGKLVQTLALERSKDGKRDEEKAECIKMDNGRRLGICNDGIYTVNLKSIDAPGNASGEVEEKVERDTVSPTRPILRIFPNDNAHTIGLHIQGEPNTEVIINNAGSYKLGDSGSLYITVVSASQWTYSTTYEYIVALRDEARNISQSSTVDHTTPAPPVKVSLKCKDGEEGVIAYPFAKDYIVTSDFDDVRHLDIGINVHTGVDFGTPHGTEILASASGEVVFATYDQYGGLGITIYHKDLGIYTSYWHLKQALVRKGDNVTKGMLIAYSNNTGLSTGDHLHFEVKDSSGRAINPWSWLKDCNLPEDSNSESGYKPIDKTTAEGVIERYIKDNLVDGTEIERHVNGNSEYKDLKDIKVDLKKSLDVHRWCDIWVQDLRNIQQKDGGTGYDGSILLNPANNTAYIMKNGIWDKYVANSGPCGVIGVPKTEEMNAHVKEDSVVKKDRAWLQRFEKGENKDNSIYAYNRKNNDEFHSYFVVNRVAKFFEGKSGTAGGYGFLTGDTYPGNQEPSYCKQWFEYGKEINLCEYTEEELNEEFDDGYIDIENTDFELDINENEVGLSDLVQDFKDMIQRDFEEVTEPLRRDCGLNPLCEMDRIWDMGYQIGEWEFKYLSGLVVGAVKSIGDLFSTIWNLIGNPAETVREMYDSIKEIMNDPTLLLKMLGSELHRIMNMSLEDRIYEVGLIMGGFIPDIVVGIVTAGGSTAGSVGKKVVDALRTSNKLLGKSIDFAQFVGKKIDFGKKKIKGTIKKVGDKVGIGGKEVMNIVKEMDDEDFEKFVNQISDQKKRDAVKKRRESYKKCNLLEVAKSRSIIPKAYGVSILECGDIPKGIAKEIIDKNGDITKVVKYIKNDKGNVLWIEEGKPGKGGSGLAHLRESSQGNNHIRQIGKAFFGDENIAEEDVLKFILDESSKIYTEGKRFSGEVKVSDKYLHLEIGSNGYIITAYPKN